MVRPHQSRFVTRCFPRPALERVAQRMADRKSLRYRIPWDDLVERTSDDVAGPRFDLRASLERCFLRKCAWRASLEASNAFRLAHRGSMSAMEASRWEGGDDRYRCEMDREQAKFAGIMLAQTFVPDEEGVVYVLSFDEYLDDLVYELHCHARDQYDDLDITAVCAYLRRCERPDERPQELIETLRAHMLRSKEDEGWAFQRAMCGVEAFRLLCRDLGSLPEGWPLGAVVVDPAHP